MGNCFVKCIKRNDGPSQGNEENSEGSLDRYALNKTPLDTDDEIEKVLIIKYYSYFYS